MTMLKKTHPAKVKVLKDDAGKSTGVVEYYASVFENVDLIGDRVKAGAFDDNLKVWRESGKMIPVVFSHQWDDLFSIVGAADPADVRADEKGLLIKATLDIDTNPSAAQLHRLMERGIVGEASFAYDVVREQKAKDGANDLIKLNIIETGPTLKGMNPETVTVSAKARKILEGSVEARQADMAMAAAEKLKSDDAYVALEATYADHIIAAKTVPGEATEYFKMTFDFEGDQLKLGEPEGVKLDDAEEHQVKAGRAISAANATSIQAAHDSLVAVGAKCAEPDALAPTGGKTVTDVETKGGEGAPAPVVEEPAAPAAPAEETPAAPAPDEAPAAPAEPADSATEESASTEDAAEAASKAEELERAKADDSALAQLRAKADLSIIESDLFMLDVTESEKQ